MADHVDANLSTGAGKGPRVSRPRHSASKTQQHQTSSSSSPSRSTSSKRKSLATDPIDLPKSKLRKVESKSSSESSAGKLKSKPEVENNIGTSRDLRKRKSERISPPRSTGRKKQPPLPDSTDSDEESATTEPEKGTKSSTNSQSKETTHSLGLVGNPKTNSSSQKGSAGKSASLGSLDPSSGSSSSSRHTTTRHSRSHTVNFNNPSYSSSSSKPNSNNKGKGKESSSSKSGPATTSEEESRTDSSSVESSSISSRLRLTPSRAAAAASLKSQSQDQSPERTSSHLTTNPSKPKGKSYKLFKFSKRSSAGGQGQAKDSSSTSTAPTTANSETDEREDTVSTQESSDTNLDPQRAPYQLRSRHSVDSNSSDNSSKTRGSSKDKFRKPSDQGGASSTSSTNLRSAHILSDKEKNLQQKNKHPASQSPTNPTSSTKSTNLRSSHRSTTASSNSKQLSNTGACTSSRCGRGGGPAAASGSGGTPLSGTSKSGEQGMSSNSSSATGGQSTSTGTSGAAASGASAAGESGIGSLSAAAAASAFSRGLAMLTGDSDGSDESEMGRLQALLEARGLPPHLFGSLAPRMQQLLNRGMSSSTVSKAQGLLQGLQSSGDEGQQLQAAIEMCQLLVMGNEDTLAGFPVKQTVPALITLLSMEHNFDMMNHACRALTYMMEALPRSTPVVAEAVPVFLEKLQIIQCMDVAEQSLTALEMLSRRHAKTILQSNGVSACLTYLDFFSITAQRAALSVTANCCQGVHSDEFHYVSDSLGFLASRLNQQDKKSVESVCLAFSRLVESFINDPAKLEGIASSELLSNFQQLLVVTPPVVSTGTFILVLRMLAQVCAKCPNIAFKLLEQNIVSTLISLLLGPSTNISGDNTLDDVELVQRNPQELLEIVTVIGELLPVLPKDGIFVVNTMMTHPHLACQDAIQWQWRDDRGGWSSYSSFDSRVIETAHQSGEDEISLTVQARTYTIDFLGMQQINEDSGTARPVQRKLNPFYNSARSAESTEKETTDVRASYLKANPEFPLVFLRPLFALLSEANSSSAGPAVRQGCVKTLLRIVHYLSPEALLKTLKPQQVSNNLASMLGSSDLKIVVGAFQLSSLLMEKLQSTYVVHFRREGVFHQISRISSSDVVGPSPIKSEIAAMLGSSSASSSNSSSSTGLSSIPIVSNNLNTISSSAFPHVPHPFIQLPNYLTRQQHAHPPLPQAPMPHPSQIPSSTGLIPPSFPHPISSQSNPFQPQSSSSYGLSLGGFFMQPGAAGIPMSLGGSGGGGPMQIPTMGPVPDSQNLNLASLPLPRVSPDGVPAVDFSSIPVPTQASDSNQDGKVPNNNAGAGETSTPPTIKTSSSSSSSGNSSSEKKPDMDPSVLLNEPFKRKRSKRPIPTSTSRRLRQDDPTVIANAAAPAPSQTLREGLHARMAKEESNNTAPGPGTGRARTPKGTSFFQNFAPSRWTRGSGHSPSTPNNNNNNPPNNNPSSSSSTPGNSSTPHAHSSGNPHPGTSGHRTGGSNSFLSVSYKEQVKSWLKEQSLLFSQKYCNTLTLGGTEGQSGLAHFDGMEILPKLGRIIEDLHKEGKTLEALQELRNVVLESDISPFELNHSGLIAALLSFLVDEEGYTLPRNQRLRDFIHVFANCPTVELSGDKLEDCVYDSTKTNGLSQFINKLNGCLSQLEQFQVKVHEVPTSAGNSRVAPSSALRFFNTHQLKCVLQRHPSCSNLRQWKGGPVKIDPLALVQAIERYLIVRGYGRIRESRESGDSDDDNSDDDIDDSLAAVVISQSSTRHKLQFTMNEHVLPYGCTVYQAIKNFGGLGVEGAGDLDTDFIDPATSVLGSSGIWSQTHTIYYRPVPEEGGASSTTSTTPVTGSAKSSSKKSKSPSSKGGGKSKKDKDPLWNEGIVPQPVPQYLPYLSAKLPESVTINDPSLPVLALLRVIHSICRYWRSLYWPVLPGPELIPSSDFINTKISAKAQRQLQDPVVIMTGNLPQWLQQIGVACPFVFPFETRQMLFYSISFDRDRALQRLLDSVPELNSSEREDRVTPRLDRRKRTISREQILAQAEQLMQEYSSSRQLLEVQYENEVGTGLGPTLEFYALVSQELQKKELELWHCESSHVHSIEDEISSQVDTKSKSYIQTSVGLFPKPLGKTVKPAVLTKVKSKFKFIGRFMAKAVMDSRLIDLPLSKTQYKWILGHDTAMNLSDIAEVDSTIAQSIQKLVSVVSAKKKLEISSGLSGTELNQALEALTLDGCSIDNLGLDFTLPGHPGIELKKGGKDLSVTIYNLEEYIKLVVYWILVGGVHRQMESWREGFDAVFPSSTLRMFYPEELEMVFCGASQSVRENWDVKTLAECCRPDHGFTNESRAIQFLYEILASYDSHQRRKFVQFVTGSPRLPVGGFKALQPPLTIVRKTIETGGEDTFLPSVMTCVNYLKLPDYSTIEIMRERLRVAADEGQMSFHLS